jgi:flagellar biosynthesis GTPase FlhF
MRKWQRKVALDDWAEPDPHTTLWLDWKTQRLEAAGFGNYNMCLLEARRVQGEAPLGSRRNRKLAAEKLEAEKAAAEKEAAEKVAAEKAAAEKAAAEKAAAEKLAADMVAALTLTYTHLHGSAERLQKSEEPNFPTSFS